MTRVLVCERDGALELRADALPMRRELRCARTSSTRQLRALVAGDVWFGPDDNTVAPLFAGYRLFEPMWDLGTVVFRSA